MLDEFGHSAANAALYADFGFDAMVVSRQQETIRVTNAKKSEASFVWKPFARNFGDEKEILTYSTYTDYMGPNGVLHNDVERAENVDQGLQNDTRLQDYNSMKKLTVLVNHVQMLTRFYPNKENYMIMIGDDFGYMDAIDGFAELE